MRVTIKGQVTIPQEIREKLGITPAVEKRPPWTMRSLVASLCKILTGQN